MLGMDVALTASLEPERVSKEGTPGAGGWLTEGRDSEEGQMPWCLLPRVSVCCGLAQPAPRAAATSCWPGDHRPCPASLSTLCHPWPSPLATSCLWPGLGASVEGWPLSCVPWAHAVSKGVESWSVLRMTFRSQVMVGSYGDSGPAGRDPGAGKMQPRVFRAGCSGACAHISSDLGSGAVPVPSGARSSGSVGIWLLSAPKPQVLLPD